MSSRSRALKRDAAKARDAEKAEKAPTLLELIVSGKVRTDHVSPRDGRPSAANQLLTPNAPEIISR